MSANQFIKQAPRRSWSRCIWRLANGRRAPPKCLSDCPKRWVYRLFSPHFSLLLLHSNALVLTPLVVLSHSSSHPLTHACTSTHSCMHIHSLMHAHPLTHACASTHSCMRIHSLMHAHPLAHACTSTYSCTRVCRCLAWRSCASVRWRRWPIAFRTSWASSLRSNSFTTYSSVCCCHLYIYFSPSFLDERNSNILLCVRLDANNAVRGKKERRRNSINRNFVGDYANYKENFVLKVSMRSFAHSWQVHTLNIHSHIVDNHANYSTHCHHLMFETARSHIFFTHASLHTPKHTYNKFNCLYFFSLFIHRA